MKIYDISQEVFTCEVYPEDPKPQKDTLRSIETGDLYNLTAFSMCAHNGTHIDAPYHFIKNGKTVDDIHLSKTVGFAYVTAEEGNIDADRARKILDKVKSIDKNASKKILIKGNISLLDDGAKVFSSEKIDLLGVESQSAGDGDNTVSVHLELLKSEIVILEGIRLDEVKEGVYFLCSAPLMLSGSDGSPCRALLIDFD